MLIPTIPLYAKTLGFGDMTLGLLVGAISITAIIIRPVAGLSLDYFGRYKLFFASLVLLLIITFSYAWVAQATALLLLRFAHGFGWGMASTACSTMASDMLPKRRFGEGMGYFSMSVSVALAVAPALGLSLFAHASFQTVTLVATALLGLALLQAFFLSETADIKRWAKGARPEIYERSAIRPAIVVGCISATMGAITGFVAIHAADKGIHNLSLFFVIYACCTMMCRPLVGRIIDHRGHQPVILPSIVFMVIALALLGKANQTWMFYLAAFFYGSGFAAVQSSLQTLAIVRAPKHRIGTANATFFTGFDAGIGLGGVCAGRLAQSFGYGGMYLAFISFLLVAIMLYFAFGRLERPQL